LEKKYETRIDRLQDKLRREERELAEDEADYSARKQEEMVGISYTTIILICIDFYENWVY
jgi:hypothetical protein